MLNYLNFKELLIFLNNNRDIPHLSKYHREDYKSHCLLVIDSMMAEYKAGRVSEEALYAACLHDIAKPRTCSYNKVGDACFYGHENVEAEEVAVFLDPAYPGFEYVLELIRAHMLPLLVGDDTPEPYRSRNQERLDNLLKNHDERFKNDLMILSDCDNRRSSIRSDADVASAEVYIQYVWCKLVAEFT